MAVSKIKSGEVEEFILSAGTDLNDIVLTGTYIAMLGGETPALPNSPTKNFVMWVIRKSVSNGITQATQLIIGNDMNMYYRTKFASGEWQAWKKVTATTV